MSFHAKIRVGGGGVPGRAFNGLFASYLVRGGLDRDTRLGWFPAGALRETVMRLLKPNTMRSTHWMSWGLRTRPPVCSGCDSRHIPAKVSSGEEGRERGEREMSRRGTRRGTDAPGDMLAHAAQIRMLSVCSRNPRLADGRLSSRDFYEVRCSAKLKTSSLG